MFLVKKIFCSERFTVRPDILLNLFRILFIVSAVCLLAFANRTRSSAHTRIQKGDSLNFDLLKQIGAQILGLTAFSICKDRYSGQKVKR